jgi:hypothetical protein
VHFCSVTYLSDQSTLSIQTEIKKHRRDKPKSYQGYTSPEAWGIARYAYFEGVAY